MKNLVEGLVLVPVESSHIKSVGYLENNLYVEFNSGMYKYFGVDHKLFEDLVKAESKGKFIRQNITGQYEYKKLS